MAIKTLQANLDPPAFQTGWYQNTITGQYYYYDAQADQWYVYAAGYLYPTFYPPGNWETAPKTVSVAPGETLRIIATFKYVGPEFSGNLYGAIGQRGPADDFDEILNKSVALSIPQYTTPTIPTIPNIDIPITSAISAGAYAIYAKITDGIGLDVGKTISKYLENAVEVVGVEAEFSEFSIDDYVKV